MTRRILVVCFLGLYSITLPPMGLLCVQQFLYDVGELNGGMAVLQSGILGEHYGSIIAVGLILGVAAAVVIYRLPTPLFICGITMFGLIAFLSLGGCVSMVPRVMELRNIGG